MQLEASSSLCNFSEHSSQGNTLQKSRRGPEYPALSKISWPQPLARFTRRHVTLMKKGKRCADSRILICRTLKAAMREEWPGKRALVKIRQMWPAHHEIGGVLRPEPTPFWKVGRSATGTKRCPAWARLRLREAARLQQRLQRVPPRGLSNAHWLGYCYVMLSCDRITLNRSVVRSGLVRSSQVRQVMIDSIMRSSLLTCGLLCVVMIDSHCVM